MMMALRERRGLNPSVAGRATLAAMPLDDDYQPGRSFEKEVRKLSKQFVKASKKSDASETDRMATQTLQAIQALAVEHGEGHYAHRYDQALANKADDWAEK